MGVISVAGPQFGQRYNVNISGDTPTPEEQERINQFVAQQEATLAQRIEGRFGPTQQVEQPVQQPEEDGGGFGTAVGLGWDQMQKAYGSTLEGIGSLTGLQGLQDYASSVIEANEQQIAEKAQELTRREDIETLGDTASFYFETLGQQVPQLGTTLAGSAAGALGGSAVPIIGTTAGAIAGGILANIPYFYGDNREAQKEAIDRGLRTEISEGTAFLAALPQAALDSIADRLLIGKVLNPKVISSGGIFTRAVKGVGAGAVAEVPTEIGQEVINRYQAGLPIDDEEAFKVYEEVAIAAGLTGGTVRGATNVIGGDIGARQDEDEKFTQLQEDAAEEAARTQENVNRIKNSEQREDEDITVEPVAEVEEEILALPAPKPQETDRLTPAEEMITLGQAAREATLPFNAVPMSELPLGERQVIQRTRRTQGVDETAPATLDEIRRVLGENVASREASKQKPVSSGTARYQPVENKSFTQEQFDRAVQEIKAQKRYTFPAIQRAIRATGVSKVPRSMVMDVRDEMVNRGYLRRSDKAANGYVVEPDVEAVSDEIASYRKTVSDLNKQIETTKRDRIGLLEEARRAQQVENNPRKARELNLQADQLETQIAEAEQTIAETEDRIARGPQSTSVPTTESPRKILPADVQSEQDTEGQLDALRQSIENYDAEIKVQKRNLAQLKRQSKKVELSQADRNLISDIESNIEQKTYLKEAAEARLAAPSSPVQVAPEKADANVAREIANRAVNTTRKTSFNNQRQRVFNALRQRLTNLGLPDVQLTAERVIAPELLEGDSPRFAEGAFTSTEANIKYNIPANRVIALSMETADPSKSAQEQFDVLKSVMNHEVIHALKSLGLFNDAEWKSLTDSVAKRKYVAIKNGKPVERRYTYLDRAKSMYSNMGLNDASIEEEAIAEMFRDYADGKIKVAGRPRTLFERIKDFFSAIFKANQDAGFKSVEDIFDNVKSGNIGKRDRVIADPTDTVEAEARAYSIKNFSPQLPMAPEGTREHKLPYELLMRGDGTPPTVPITQKYTPANAARNNSSIEQIMQNNPDALMSVDGWMKAMQEGLGGDFIPAPPLVAIEYSQNPQVMADKLKQLTPELKKGVDEGFEFVDQIRNIYESGEATPRMTMDLFVWGILSRGAGPVQQEGAFIDIIDSAYPLLEKATREPLTEDDVDRWMNTVSSVIPEGSPGKQVTMNVNAAGKLVRAMSQFVGDTNRTVIDVIHEGMSDPNVSASDIREAFLSSTEGAGIDNKVLSFILLVGGKDDVLVMDRIQGRHLWDDGRYGGANIYDGIGPNGEGLNGIFRGPRGILSTRLLEDGMRKNVQKAYELAGRPEDASLGRWHWETWVIEGEQVVNHGTLQAIINGSPIGTSVTEGKTDTFSSNMTYIRGENAAVVEYPLSDGGVVYMSPVRFKEFTSEIAKDAGRKNSKTGVFKSGNFKVTARADIPWFERKEVDRDALDRLAREYQDAKPNGSILRSDERVGEGKDASRRGNSPIDKRYSLGFLKTDGVRSEPQGGRRGRDQAGSLAPLEGAPTVQGASGPDENLVSVAERYARENGIDLRRQSEFVQIDEARAARIAQAYEDMEHAPQDPEVQEAYQNLINQTRAQYDALIDDGYEFTFFDANTDPYDGNPWNAMRDLRANKRMAVYGTYDGYGTEGITQGALDDNPMLQDTGLKWKDQNGIERPVTANDLFRAVHDAFGHGLEGAGFRARGEENAWQAHVRLFTGSAIPAITSETRGQNSWLNYGPFGETNRTAQLEDTVFADQKTGLMPEFTWQEGVAGSVEPTIEEEFEQVSIADNLPAADKSAIEQLLEGQPMTSKTMFSVAPVNPNQLIAAPVKNKDGSTTPIFGSIRDRGKLIPVVLPAGEHRVFEQDRGVTEAGRGLYHIQQRGHDRELLRFSKNRYKAENAIYDLLRRWQNQGYEDGEDVIGYPSRGGYVLEWRNNRPFSAPPMQLVLKPRKLGSGYVYDIQTFYPDLEKKDRAIVDGRTRYSLAAATDSARFFDDDALRIAANQNEGSREILSVMPIRNFLSAAMAGRDAYKESSVEQLLRSGQKFNSVPFLYVRNNGDGTGLVTGHEGRHRARALANLGYTEMPVLIVSQGGDGPAIRWGQQDDIGSRDYVPPEQRPSVLIGEDGGTIPMPDVSYDSARTRYSIAPVQYSMNTLAGQVQQKNIDINYARASDFIAKQLGRVMPKDKAQARADNILRKFQDNMLPVGRMIQELKADKLEITDAMDTYLREELYHGIVGKEVTARQDGIYRDAVDAVKAISVTDEQIKQLQRLSDANAKGSKGFVSQALETSRDNRSVLADAYLYAKHAKERNAYIRSINPENDSGSGMTDAEANAMLTWFSTLDNQNSIALGALDRSVRDIVNDTNRVRRDSGLIPDDFGEIELEDGTVVSRSNYTSYVPLRGKLDPENEVTDPSRPARGAPFGARGREDPRATGRYDYAENILETTMVQNQNSIARGERNKVGQSFLELLRADPEKTKGYATILEALPKKEVLQGRKVMLKTDTMAYLDPFIYTVKENGKDVYVRLQDENIAKALKGDSGVGAGMLEPVLRSMGKINRYLSNINTTYNPEFMITNLFRDLQTAGVNINQYDEKGITKEVVTGTKGALKGIYNSIVKGDDSSEWAKYYKDFVDAGGQNATNQMNTIQDQMDNVRNLLGDISTQGMQGKWNSVKNSFIGQKTGSLLSYIENLNTAVENGIRVSTYKALLDRGFSRDRAAQAARNVTVNFAKGGEYKQFMNAFYLFYNASLQGSFALLNAALKSKKVQKLWVAVTAAGLLQDQLNSMMSDEDDDGRKIYDKIPDYILEHNLIIMDPFGISDRGYTAIPMPYGLNMAHNIGRATSQALRGGTTAGKATSSIVGTIVDTVNPLGGTESFANFAAPTVLDPFIDVLENEDFSKKPIYKEGYPGDRTPDSQKYWSTTNPSSIWVAKTLNELTGGTASMSGFIDLNPDVMNFWLQYATGGVGRFVQRSAELPFRVYEDGLSEELIREIPFVRKAFGSISEREDYGSFVEKREKILVVGEELRDSIKSGDTERLQRARSKYAEEIALLPRIKAIDNAIRKVSRQINQVRDNARLPDSQRELLMERLNERKQDLISRGNMIMKDYQ